MKTKFITLKIAYDGTQLSPLYAYKNHRTAGDSVVAFIGSCNVNFEHMIDAEDLIAAAKIEGDLMLHFIIELFSQDLMTAVSLQRLLVSMAQSILNLQSPVLHKNPLVREGDDLYYFQGKKKQKLSISIASCSAVSSMIHFAVNIINEGTPVVTCSLKDFKIIPKEFAKELMRQFSEEFSSIVEATEKVKPL